MATMETLRKSVLFSTLGEEKLGVIARFCQEEEYPPGAVISTEGEKGKEFYVLEEGTIQLRIRVGATEETIDTARERGDVFGWSCLLEPGNYTVSSRCLDHSKVVKVQSGALRTYLEQEPATGYRVMKGLAQVVSDRLTKTRAHLHSLLAPGVISRG